MSDEPLAIPLDEIQVDDKLHFIKEPVEIVDREVKRIKQIRIPTVKVRWNSRRASTNGLVERANRSLGEGIKARLDERSKNWLEEISHVLWAHRTMIKSNNGETLFSLTYGTEAVIPIEIGMPTLRTAEAAIQEAKSKAKMEKYYNARVRNTSFGPGDLVYRNNEASHAEEGGKLRPKREGPYEVTEALGKGAYKLRDRNRNVLHVRNLKKCYVHEM
ncbi:reverse transcriptase domain-containing protein [Tanacetum coccineum]